MNFAFDLISDLYLEPDQPFDWAGRATSLYCVIAGNISSDRNTLYNTLEHLSDQYEQIFYIDGMLEHTEFLDNPIAESYEGLIEIVECFDNILFLHDNIAVVNGVGILATNGWTTFNFDPTFEESLDYFIDNGDYDNLEAGTIISLAHADTMYLKSSIETCQKMHEIENVVVVSNSVPIPALINHDKNLEENHQKSIIGNLGITQCLDSDIQRKIHTWCFGRYDGDMDISILDVRFVNNTAKEKEDAIYYPKRITI
jgi:hypothetical protein